MPTEAYVSKAEFKARVLEYLRQVEISGARLIITDDGRSVAEVRPLRADKLDARALLRGSVLSYDHATDPVGDEDWEALAYPHVRAIW